MKSYTRHRTWILPVFCILFFALPLAAQNQTMDNNSGHNSDREEFWISPLIEFNMYNLSGLAFGGGLAFAYGDELAIGLRVAWFRGDNGETSTMEINILLRWYILNGSNNYGPYIQIGAGPVLFAQEESLSIPAGIGSISAGANLGWRFSFGQNWFIEPAIRIGFPYLAGVGVSGGYRF